MRIILKPEAEDQAPFDLREIISVVRAVLKRIEEIMTPADERGLHRTVVRTVEWFFDMPRLDVYPMRATLAEVAFDAAALLMRDGFRGPAVHVAKLGLSACYDGPASPQEGWRVALQKLIESAQKPVEVPE